jgi:hypothetical protein
MRVLCDSLEVLHRFNGRLIVVTTIKPGNFTKEKPYAKAVYDNTANNP